MSQPVDNAPKENEGVTEPQEGTEKKETNSQDSWTVDDYKRELSKVRQEAASRRVALREQEEAAKKWKEYEESQKSELQKLQDQLAEKERLANESKLEATRIKIAKQFNVADDDIDLLVGDEESMKRLAERLGAANTEGGSGGNHNPDLKGGARGKPVGGSADTFSMEDFIRGRVTR